MYVLTASLHAVTVNCSHK